VAARGTAGPLSRRHYLLLAGLVTGLAAALVALAALVPKASEDRTESRRREAILRAARQEAVNLTTIDAEHLDRDIQRILDGATGEFKEQFAAGSNELTNVLTTSKSTSTGEVLEAGIVTADDDSAQVLVVVDSRITNAQEPQGRLSHYRLQLDLVRQGSRWLTARLEFR
jgi:Mce-associated membrane protein